MRNGLSSGGTRRRSIYRALPGAALALENLAIFDRHYFAGYGFPWDFIGSYYASIAYWTTAVARGALSMWMPFQSMGYPFPINLQTGLWYAPLWFFPLLKIPYTLHAAVVVQCLHVLLGAFGMYVLLRAIVRSRREALVGAFCFQLFGGFYSNAQHVDIVRSFAFTPWLLWCLTPPRRGESAIPRRLALLPLFVWATATGGYPGNFIAALFLLAVFAAFVLAARRFRRPAVVWAATALGGVALGLTMAAIQLGPAWLFRAELSRYHVTETIRRMSLELAHVPALFLSNRDTPGNPSMNSTFVGFLVLAGVCFLSRRSLRRLWPYALLLLLAAAMAAGDNLPIHAWLRGLLPPLAYSRFPSSDYRGFAAVLLVVLAAFGWRDLRRQRRIAADFSARLIVLVLFVAWGLERARGPHSASPEQTFALVCLALSVGALAVWQGGRPGRGLAPLAILLVVASLDGGRVLSRMETWSVKDLIGLGREFYPTPARLADAGLVLDPAVFREPKPARPPRREGDHRYWAAGYLTGSYEIYDFGGGTLRAVSEIVTDPVYLDFMRREWLPILVEPAPPSRAAGDAIDVRDLRGRLCDLAPDPRVRQLEYGMDRIVYRVRLERPALLVENETFFPGWSARLSGRGVSTPTLRARRVNGIWRGWLLPAGEYAMEASFRFPHLSRFAAVSAAGWLVWLAAAAVILRRGVS